MAFHWFSPHSHPDTSPPPIGAPPPIHCCSKQGSGSAVQAPRQSDGMPSGWQTYRIHRPWSRRQAYPYRPIDSPSMPGTTIQARPNAVLGTNCCVRTTTMAPTGSQVRKTPSPGDWRLLRTSIAKQRPCSSGPPPRHPPLPAPFCGFRH